jgi:nucleoside-diphosphate-sugar epimerase
VSSSVVVTGSCGFVGARLCRELVTHGYRVRALARSSSNRKALAGLELEIVEGDIREPESLERAFQGAEHVFHIAALYREARFPDSEYWRTNHQGTINVFEVARKCGVRKVLHCSTIGVHSTIKNPPANESEPYAPTDLYQETKVAAEKSALEFFASGLIGGAVIRPAMIWGPTDTRFLKMFRGIAQGRFPLIGGGENLCHWILVDDLARAFRLAAERETATGVYIIAGERPVSLRYTLETIAAVYGQKRSLLSIPAWPFQAAGSVVETLCRPLGIEPPLHRRRVDFFIKNRAFDCSRAKKDLGFEASQRFEDEARLVAEWYKKEGWV